MELAGERDRGEDERRHDEAPPLEREQHRGQEERDEPEQMPGRLPDPVRHQAEHHAADECGRTRDVERAQPPARERPGEHEREEHDEVVRPDVPEQRRQAASTGGPAASPGGSAAPRPRGGTSTGRPGARRRARADDRRARSSSRAAGGRRRPPRRARPRGGRGSAPRRAGSPARSPRARRPSTARAPRERSGCDRRPRGDDRIGRRPLELATHCCKRSSRSTTPGRAESRSASGTARRRSTPCGCACRPT